MSSERDFQRRVERLLVLYGYVFSHTHALRTTDGWRTPGTPGWPDLVALRPPRIIAIECKQPREKPTPKQRAWLTLFSQIPCARTWLLRPTDDIAMVENWLRRPKLAPDIYGFDIVEQPLALIGQRIPRTPAAPH